MTAIARKIRFLREQQQLSQRALAEQAGISAAALSQLEAGQSSPSVATLEKLADGLGVAVAAFFLDHSEQDIEVIELADRPSVALAGGGYFVPLTASQRPAGFEPMLLQLVPGGSFDEHSYGIQSVRVFTWVRHGEIVLEYDGQRRCLRERQSVYFDARKPHNWYNESTQPCELLMVRSR